MRHEGSLLAGIRAFGRKEIALLIVHLHQHATSLTEIGNMLLVVQHCARKKIPIFFFQQDMVCDRYEKDESDEVKLLPAVLKNAAGISKGAVTYFKQKEMNVFSDAAGLAEALATVPNVILGGADGMTCVKHTAMGCNDYQGFAKAYKQGLSGLGKTIYTSPRLLALATPVQNVFWLDMPYVHSYSAI